MLRGQHGRGQSGHAHHQRGDHIGHVPAQQRLGLEGPHAGEVHQGQADAEHQAGGEGPGGLAAVGGQGEGCAGAQDRHQEGEGRADRLVAGVHRRGIGQHGHEVGRPDADAGDQGGQDDAEDAGAPGAGLGVGEQPERGQRRHDADHRRHDHQTQIVLRRDAAKDFEHRANLPKRRRVR